jgi:hypothetical protein
MSYDSNTAPAVGTHMLTQLLLALGLPMIIIPLVATAAYFGFRRFRAQKLASSSGDIEMQSIASSSNSKTSPSDGDKSGLNVIPALATNSVHVPLIVV